MNAAAADPREKRRELLAFLFLTLVLAPVLAVLIVAGYGFVVWMYQIIAGPPTV
jgi:periplasmic nitrate reductase NapE